MSDTNLLSALLAFQADAPSLQKDKINPAFKSKYLSLNALMEQILPTLNRHGLVWATFPTHLDGYPALNYRLIHAESGEVMEGTMLLLLSKQDPQGLGSALTYARRQTVMAVLGLVADEDDDANKASGGKPREAPRQVPPPQLSEDAAKAVSAAVRAAGMPQEWLRMTLIDAGVQNVPEGPITPATIRALTPEQADRLVTACADVANAREKATA